MKRKAYTLSIIIFFIWSQALVAQLGFCNGNSGDAIFTETFGSGFSNNALPTGTTTYSYTNNFPDDGFYTVNNGTFGNPFNWHQTLDHTVGDANGKCLIVNAGFSAGEFYRTTVSGLCETTTYEFSAWLINLVIKNTFCATQPSGTIPINVRFEIWDSSDTNILASGNTENIVETSTVNWKEYGLVFQTLPGQSSVILKMINNGAGGCGNDLAIDDIVFKSCGDFITVQDDVNNSKIEICSSETPYVTVLKAVPDNTVFSTQFYQWQDSVDGLIWTDISGENSTTITVTGISDTRYYRAKVAEIASNLNNELCNVTSEIFQLKINTLPIPPIVACWETATINTANCSWNITGTEPLQPTVLECWETSVFNNTTCTWEVLGTQPLAPVNLKCWETVVFNTVTCEWDINGEQPVNNENKFISFCEGDSVKLLVDTTIQTPNYLWDTGETSAFLEVENPGVYSVKVSNSCAVKVVKFTVTQYATPIIKAVSTSGKSIVVNTKNTKNFEYSINGNDYQLLNVFPDIEAGLYTVYVKNINCNTSVEMQYLHFYIPKFFTPNNDGKNDTFNIKGLDYFKSSEVYIFNRFGKLLKTAINTPLSWNGTYNSAALPPSDYWYVIIIDGNRRTGHITLKR